MKKLRKLSLHNENRVLSVETPLEGWTLASAMSAVLEQAQDSKLDAQFWTACAEPLAHIDREMDIRGVKAVFLAYLIERGKPTDFADFADFLGCSRLNVMTHGPEINELLTQGWIGLFNKGKYLPAPGLETALANNRRFVPERLDNLSMQNYMERLLEATHRYFDDCGPMGPDVDNYKEEVMPFTYVNGQLPLCSTAMSYSDENSGLLLLLAVCRHCDFHDTEDEAVTFDFINEMFEPDYLADGLRKKLKGNNHPLIADGWLEQECVDGLADPNRYVLTERAKSELLDGFTIPAVEKEKKKTTGLMRVADITPKPLFYNAAEDQQIQRLTKLLSPENFEQVQERLKTNGMRQGFACLFYGAPGTGKTESVLQIARQTGRDIMQVEIAGMRDKWVGESEKNIAGVFRKYRRLCKESELTPILFFNEADALINKRTTNVERSVEKMDNAMQNILLQEMENLDGILIATTNLTSNLDSAFERRFLFKMEFHKPDADVKTLLWKSMVEGLSEQDARTLAMSFDFSGGQIENIARQQTIDLILNGGECSLDNLIGYCQNESRLGANRPRIGFN